jgi:hypothetical protein
VLGTDEIFAAAGDARRQALAIGNQAAALEGIGRSEEALEAYSRSADLLASLGETELRANVMQSASALQLRMGRQLEALASMQAGLSGLKHPTPKQRLVRRLLGLPFRWLDRN